MMPPPLPTSDDPVIELTKARKDAAEMEVTEESENEGRMENSSGAEEIIEREKQKKGAEVTDKTTEAMKGTVQPEKGDAAMEVVAETEPMIEKEKDKEENKSEGSKVSYKTTEAERGAREINFRSLLLSDDLREEDICLVHDKDCNIFLETGNVIEPPREAFIAMRKSDKVFAIMRNGGKFGKREEIWSAWRGVAASTIWGRNKFEEKVTVIPYHTNGDLREAAKAVSNLKTFQQRFQKARKLPKLSDCYCAKPIEKDDVTITSKGERCRLIFHPG